MSKASAHKQAFGDGLWHLRSWEGELCTYDAVLVEISWPPQGPAVNRAFCADYATAPGVAHLSLQRLIWLA